MALMTISFRSEVLDLQTHVNVLIPDQWSPDNPPATLYLLHGLSGDYSSWIQKTSLLRYAEKLPLTIIMPSADRSFYTDMVYGNRYWTYLTKELPERLQTWLPLATTRNKCFVGGLSMGGYGALKWGLNYPEQFSGIISMSGAVDLQAMVERAPEYLPGFQMIFGDLKKFSQSANDLFSLVDKVSDQGRYLPDILQFCGTADFLYADNLVFKAKLDRSKLPHRFSEKNGVKHEWSYWDETIRYTLDWIAKKIGAATDNTSNNTSSISQEGQNHDK